MSSMLAQPVQSPPLPDSGIVFFILNLRIGTDYGWLINFELVLIAGGGGGGSGTRERSEERGGTVKMEEKEKRKEGSPSIRLGLGIDGNTTEKPVVKHGKCVFTTAQLHELQLQALIYKYIAGGIPVPLHLVIPIWKSVASSGSAHGGIYDQYPSCKLSSL